MFCRAEISSLVTGIFVMIVLLCLTEVFLYMPNNAQGAIIISGVITLFDHKEAIFLWRVRHCPLAALSSRIRFGLFSSQHHLGCSLCEYSATVLNMSFTQLDGSIGLASAEMPLC